MLSKGTLSESQLNFNFNVGHPRRRKQLSKLTLTLHRHTDTLLPSSRRETLLSHIALHSINIRSIKVRSNSHWHISAKRTPYYQVVDIFNTIHFKLTMLYTLVTVAALTLLLSLVYILPLTVHCHSHTLLPTNRPVPHHKHLNDIIFHHRHSCNTNAHVYFHLGIAHDDNVVSYYICCPKVPYQKVNLLLILM